MDPKRSGEIIAAAGGCTAFARMIGLDPATPGVSQRVSNWRRRGIPSAVVLGNLKIVKRLEKTAGLTG